MRHRPASDHNNIVGSSEFERERERWRTPFPTANFVGSLLFMAGLLAVAGTFLSIGLSEMHGSLGRKLVVILEAAWPGLLIFAAVFVAIGFATKRALQQIRMQRKRHPGHRLHDP